MVAALDFEQEVHELETQLASLRNDARSSSASEVLTKINELNQQLEKKFKKLYSSLDAWQTCQVARHPQRPQSKYYLTNVFSNFVELHGDRMYRDDSSIIAGLAQLGNMPVMVISQHKGDTTETKIAHNFGMPKPEGYRKAQRLMKLAAKFNLPLVTLIDTPGAYPGIDAEERGQAQAIGACLLELATLKTPIVATVIGEGGSGGALALGVADEVLMFENSIYSVISPEGCASILWRDAQYNKQAAAALRLTAKDLFKLKLITRIIQEPIGGAQRNPEKTAKILKAELIKTLAKLNKKEINLLLKERSDRSRQYGSYEG